MTTIVELLKYLTVFSFLMFCLWFDTWDVYSSGNFKTWPCPTSENKLTLIRHNYNVKSSVRPRPEPYKAFIGLPSINLNVWSETGIKSKISTRNRPGIKAKCSVRSRPGPYKNLMGPVRSDWIYTKQANIS